MTGEPRRDLLAPAKRETVGLDPVAEGNEAVGLRHDVQGLFGFELSLDERGAGGGRGPRLAHEPDEPSLDGFDVCATSGPTRCWQSRQQIAAPHGAPAHGCRRAGSSIAPCL